jgi:hypothetical protein
LSLAGIGESHRVVHLDISGAGGELGVLVSAEDLVEVVSGIVEGLVDFVTNLLKVILE